MAKQLRIAVLEPYYGGSHAAFVDTFVSGSRHTCEVATLPARKWKWRMRGASAWFVREGGWKWDVSPPPDVLLVNDMLSVSDLRALLPQRLRGVPIACYFHENQLTYPIPDESDRDYQYGMTNIISCLASDAVWFNSAYHLEAFVAAAERLLRKMPDFVPIGGIQEMRDKSEVLWPPIDVEPAVREPRKPGEPPTILWSHRWEYDKNPEAFFEALIRLARQGGQFRLVLTGEQFRTAPPVFAEAWPHLEQHIIHAGYLPSRAEYVALLRRCDIVVSTAIQENFGLAVVEAVLAGCQPLLPDRLAYPEVIPPEYHVQCLYGDDSELCGRLEALVAGEGWLTDSSRRRLETMLWSGCGAPNAVQALDDAIESLASRGEGP